MEVKFSMDYETGATGIMLAILDSNEERKTWASWLPLLRDNKLNIFNISKSNTLFDEIEE